MSKHSINNDALVVLEDGRCFGGESFGAAGTSFGEAVFTTGMTGYQETLTDPSYHRQVVVMTAPQIGNTGWNGEDNESGRIWVSGFVVRDLTGIDSNWRSSGSLQQQLIDQGIVAVQGIDTRALTRHLRDRGAMRVGLFTGDDAARPREQLVALVNEQPRMAGAYLAGEVSTSEPYVVEAVGEQKFTVAAIDLGIKSSTPEQMAARGMRVHVLPATASMEEVRAVNPDGIFFSNGPGDPAAAGDAVALMQQALEAKLPVFGICFGNQILGRALGLGTYKLKFGHRGVNVPVRDKATGRIEITSQNHGFAVDAPTEGHTDTPYGRVEVSHVCVNDDVVEGLRCLDVPAFSVQHHPEAAAGPHDAGYLFDRFADMMTSQKEQTNA
ncbi:glutamine-hydrolyzing carbamoyl-phosphate synthase small subunit [Cumulibacter soli]|uniref:glutamine-hydrolyzing carbamoyl-phosphate synthase small subunit n=1 Tax=Cumulibacter soli TaxID=2546344 RepID=UPI001067335A|nr:glutamine-hydrolyzing carbamoyl-phosphate synthase small subunit [Cumulibacter soli]